MRTGQVRAAFSWTPLGRSRPTVDAKFEIEPGERVLIVGRSGSGKSTVLHGIAGALGTTIAGDFTGQIEVGGRIGFIPQNPTDGIVAEHLGRDIAFGPENLGLEREEIHRRIKVALADVALPYPTDYRTAALSGGEQQRLALAGALALRPDVILLDEPTSMLDADVAAQVRDAVDRVVGDRTMIVVEHQFDGWLSLVDRVIVLDAGQVVLDGAVAEFEAAAPPGLWHPDAPAPIPVEVAAELVRPEQVATEVSLDRVTVDLTSRTLQGSRTSRILNDFSARLEPAAVTALVGPSGSGKSTALLTAAGLLRPVVGRVTPDRIRLKTRLLAAGLGWVPQNPEHGFVSTNVRQEVALTAGRVNRTVDPDEVLAAVGLSKYAQSHPYRLSGGEQRRLALAAALAHRPEFLVLDEPTVGQDRDTWALVVGWLQTAAAQGTVVAVSTHDQFLPRTAEVELAMPDHTQRQVRQ